jgi:hypothetical protein
MRRETPVVNRSSGSILIIVTVLTILIAGLTAAVVATSFAFQRTSLEMLERELAFRASDSGGAYYLSKLMADSDYFDSNPAPHAPVVMKEASFTLESVDEVGNGQWHLLLRGNVGGTTFPLNTVLGHRQIQMPDGIVAVGTGSPSSTVLQLTGSRVDSFDPADGAYDPSNPGEDANVAARGSINLSSSTVYGDATATGTSTEDGSSRIEGDLEENVPDFAVDDIDPIVYDAMNESRTANDNSRLAAIFGSQWTPLAGSENYGNLIVTTNTTYVIPAGTYRFRRFEVRNGASVRFDTSTGPARLIYVGSGAGTGTGNDLIVTGGSSVKVANGGTTNGLLTVLGPDCDFAITSNAVFGQSTDDPNNAGYTQIISLGGNTSSDNITASGGAKVYGRVYAAAHVFTVDGASWYGSALTRTVNVRNSTFAVDLGSLGTTLNDPSSYQVLARWPAGG